MRNHIAPVPVADDLDLPNIPSVSAETLRSFIERIERLEGERRDLGDDIKEVKKEAKGSGFDIPVINLIIRERRKDADDLEEFNTVADTYRRALGM